MKDSNTSELKTEPDITDYPSPKVAWTTLIILTVTYMFSFMDRQILTLLIDPIKTDLNISDTQVGLLTGIAFALVYTLACIPMGRIADLWVRKYLIIGGVTVWSLLTITCGFARNFPQMFLARMGVGLGEAALTPTAYAMVPDLFPPNKLARGMSVYALGGLAGGAVSIILGGTIIALVNEVGPFSLPLMGTLKAWQMVLIIAGSLSLLMVIPLSLMPEPKRHGVQAVKGPQKHQHSFRQVLSYLWRYKAFYGLFIAGIGLQNLFSFGFGTWVPTYFIRVHGWEASSAGITLGSLYLLPAVFGALISGWLADYFFNKGYRAAPLYMMVTLLSLFIPLALGLVYIPNMQHKMVVLVLLGFTDVGFAVLFPTIIQMATLHRIRAQVSAMVLLAVNLAGYGLGPLCVALVTDYLFQDEMAIGHAMAFVSVLCVPAFICLCFAINPFKQRVITVMGDADHEPKTKPIKPDTTGLKKDELFVSP